MPFACFIWISNISLVTRLAVVIGSDMNEVNSLAPELRFLETSLFVSTVSTT